MFLELFMLLFIEWFYFLFFIFLFVNFLVVLYNKSLRLQRIVIISRFQKYMLVTDYNLKVKEKFIFLYYKIYYFLLCLSVVYYYLYFPVNLWFCFDFLIYFDYFSAFSIVIFFIFFSLFLLINIKLNIDYMYYFEYLFIIILINFFVLFLFKVYDFLFIYILVEGVSLCLYILAASNYSSIKVSEAGLKYFILAVLSSLFFLFGISVIYSIFASVNFFKIKILCLVLNLDSFNFYKLVFAFFLIVGSFLFKLGAAPFHIWVVEVYQGVTFITFFFFSIYSKLIFIFILFKLLFTVFLSLSSLINIIFLFFGIASICCGVVGSLIVLDVRRLLAYGSIAHVGFLLLSLINLNFYSIFSFFFYLIVYLFLMFSFFLFVLLVKGVHINTYNNLLDYTVLKTSSLFVTFFIFFIFLSMGGVPPFLGFYTKFIVLLNLLSNYVSNVYIIIFILCINLIGIYVYLRLGVYLFFSGNALRSFKVLSQSFSLTLLIYLFFFFNFIGFIFLPLLYNYLYICSFYYLLCFI